MIAARRRATDVPMIECDDCNGRGGERDTVCISSRPMSRCDGCCPGCQADVTCPSCDGTGEVVDLTKLCPVCVEDVGDEAPVTGGRLCGDCAHDEDDTAREPA